MLTSLTGFPYLWCLYCQFKSVLVSYPLWLTIFYSWCFFFGNFRIHRSIMCGVYNGLPQFTSHSGCSEDRSNMGITLASQILSSKALHSWVYPQSSLPPSLISVLTSSAKEGGLPNITFTQTRFPASSFLLFQVL